MYTSNNQLVLYPQSPDNGVDNKQLIHLLKKMGFAGDQEGDNRFQTGDKFLSYICFLGCSPDIELEPQEDKPYTYIEIPESTGAIRFISGVNVKVPRCPECRKDLSQLPDQLRDGEVSNTVPCQHCQFAINVFQLNWRKTACFLCSSVIVGNIYEAEAVPDVQLLDTLQQETGFVWKYAYLRYE